MKRPNFKRIEKYSLYLKEQGIVNQGTYDRILKAIKSARNRRKEQVSVERKKREAKLILKRKKKNRTQTERFKRLFPVTKNKVLARMFGRTESGIRSWASKLGLKKKGWGYTPKEDAYLIVHYYVSGEDHCAAHLGRSIYSIRQRFYKLTKNRVLVSSEMELKNKAA